MTVTVSATTVPPTGAATTGAAAFRAARDLLLDLRDDHDAAVAQFSWPRLTEFNWAIDFFDEIARDNHRDAVRVVTDTDVRSITYAQLSARSNQLANWLRARGVARGDRLLLMLDNDLPVWETLLAAMKLGIVVIPTFTTVSAGDLIDRVQRGQVRHVITDASYTDRFAAIPELFIRIAVGERKSGWLDLSAAYSASTEFVPDGPTRATDPLFLYFTSGTTSRPKLVPHTHESYPVGHLSGMYYNGLRPGDMHLNVSAPGWAKHAWSSFFVPLNAEATVIAVNIDGDPRRLLDQLVAQSVTTFCAPPTVWRLLIQHDLTKWPVRLREATAVGEPLNPEVIEQIRSAWGVTVRDGYGQTETTAQVGNSPSLPMRAGSMGKPLPGYDIDLIDPVTGQPADEGEICVDLSRRPVCVMPGYLDNPEKNAETFAGGRYHTGDVARRDADGYLYYVGRTDDVFKSYDHRISPFELESVLLEHDDVVEAAVVPAPDPIGMFVPKAFVAVRAGVAPDTDTARSILAHGRDRLGPHQLVRRMEFGDLPKTTSGKIRRAELRKRVVGTEFSADDLLNTTGPSAPGLA